MEGPVSQETTEDRIRSHFETLRSLLFESSRIVQVWQSWAEDDSFWRPSEESAANPEIQKLVQNHENIKRELEEHPDIKLFKSLNKLLGLTPEGRRKE